MNKSRDWTRTRPSEWEYHGQKRPPFAIKPDKNQESVWDYPRPPKLAPDKREVLVIFANKIIAHSTRGIRVLETASPPSFYIPTEDVNMSFIKKNTGEARCEWKGEAIFWNVEVDDEIAERAAWSYPKPLPDFYTIKSYMAFYPAKVHCYVNGEEVKPQPGQYYGGWITKEIVGPVKGESDETYL
jgi:uncharacterized protein (DUF427 family)